jgi:hypothetical protein
MQEQALLEQEQSKLFGLTQPQHDQDLIRQASSFWLSQTMLANLIIRYLQTLGVTNIPASLGQKSITTLQLGQGIREKLLKQCQNLTISGEAVQNWQRWLKGNDPYLPLTFNQDTADRRDLIFITPTHPLAQQAALSVEPDTPMLCNLTAQTNIVPTGRYPYAINRWQKKGLKEDFTFQPLTTNPQLTAQFLEVLETAQALETEAQIVSEEEEQELEKHHYRHWLDSRAAHIEQVQQHVKSRLDSLQTTHNARIASLKDQLEANSNDKIQRMKLSQIETANRDFRQHVEQLEQAAT